MRLFWFTRINSYYFTFICSDNVFLFCKLFLVEWFFVAAVFCSFVNLQTIVLNESIISIYAKVCILCKLLVILLWIYELIFHKIWLNINFIFLWDFILIWYKYWFIFILKHWNIFIVSMLLFVFNTNFGEWWW